jgi:hypothetical protein
LSLRAIRLQAAFFDGSNDVRLKAASTNAGSFVLIVRLRAASHYAYAKANRLKPVLLYFNHHIAPGAFALKSAVCETITIQRPLRLAIIKFEYPAR